MTANPITTKGDPMPDTDNAAQGEPIDLDASWIETLPDVVAEMLARAYRAKGIEAPIPEATP